MNPPAPATRSANAGTSSVPPVARRMWLRKSGLPTSRTTILSPSIRPMRLPCRPWRAGWQPVATDAADTRVTEGNTALCSAHHWLVPAHAVQNGRRLGPHPVAAKTIAAHEYRPTRPCHA